MPSYQRLDTFGVTLFSKESFEQLHHSNSANIPAHKRASASDRLVGPQPSQFVDVLSNLSDGREPSRPVPEQAANLGVRLPYVQSPAASATSGTLSTGYSAAHSSASGVLRFTITRPQPITITIESNDKPASPHSDPVRLDWRASWRRTMLVWNLQGGSDEKANRAWCYACGFRVVRNSDLVALGAQ
jgi:hypothetical protein